MLFFHYIDTIGSHKIHIGKNKAGREYKVSTQQGVQGNTKSAVRQETAGSTDLTLAGNTGKQRAKRQDVSIC